MVKIFYTILYVLCFSTLSCQSLSKIESKLHKRIDKYGNHPIEGIVYNKLYVMEGSYTTLKNFVPILPKLEIHRASDQKKYEDYLLFYENGKVEQFYAENLNSAYQLLKRTRSSNFHIIFYKKNNKIILEQTEAFKMTGGYGTNKAEVKVIDNKIYIQEVGKCFVYILTEE